MILGLPVIAGADTPVPQQPDVYYYFTLQKMNRFPNHIFIAYPFQNADQYKCIEPANRLRITSLMPSFYAIDATLFDQKAADQNPARYFASDPNLIRSDFNLSPESAIAELSRKKSDSVTEIIEVVSIADKKLELRAKDRIYATKQKYTPYIIFALIIGGAIWMTIIYGKSRRKNC